MPLETGHSRETIGTNIAKLIGEGRPRAQAAAIAYREAGIAKDMSDEDWDELLGGLGKFFAEEREEPEHQEGAQDSLAFDKASVRTIDKDGHLFVETTPISKAVVNPYYGREIPNYQSLGLDPGRVYKLYRDPEELAKSAQSFAGKPLLLIHTPSNAADHPREVTVGSIGDTVEFKDPYLMAPLNIWDGEAIGLIQSGEQRELSCGYRYVPVMTSGTTPDGDSYDGIMTKIEGNHLALVKEGRAGPDVVVGDSAISPLKETRFMATKPVLLTRKASLAHGALIAFLQPKLATDAKLDLTSALAEVTSKNYAIMRPGIVVAVTSLTDGKLAKDAKLDGMDAVLMALDAMEPEEEMPKPAVKDKAKDKAKDGKTMDKKARDEAREELKEKLKEKLSEDDWKAACDDLDGMEADDEGETEEEKKKREAKEKEETEGAQDAAIQSSVATATQKVREAERGIRLALVDVRPWVGELSPGLALDSKDDVYRHAAVTLGVVNAKALHADALWPIIQAQPKPGAHRPEGHSQMGLDSAATDKAAKYAPGISRIKAA